MTSWSWLLPPRKELSGLEIVGNNDSKRLFTVQIDWQNINVPLSGPNHSTILVIALFDICKQRVWAKYFWFNCRNVKKGITSKPPIGKIDRLKVTMAACAKLLFNSDMLAQTDDCQATLVPSDGSKRNSPAHKMGTNEKTTSLPGSSFHTWIV